jgi:site-specific recombinase XerD
MSERVKIADTLIEWQYTLRAARMSPHTVKGYAASMRQFVSFLEQAGLSTIVPEIQPRHCRMFLAYLFDQGKADTTVLTRWAGLRAYFNFTREAEMLSGASPMDGVAKPSIEQKVIPEVSTDSIRALLASCDRKTFRGARDYAIMRLLTRGMRRGEIAGIELGDMNLDSNEATVMVHGKGSKQRRVALGPRDVVALTAYVRQRRKYVDSLRADHPAVKSSHLFVSKYGAFGGPGIEKMLNRKCEELGIKRANAHAWRHTWAGEWKAQGGSDEGLMAQGGWATNREIRRYTAHNRERTSVLEAQRLSIGDNL